MNDAPTQKNQRVLVLSDLHKGGSLSKFEKKFQRAIEEKIGEADHIVLNGDVFELFDILNVTDASKSQFGLVKGAEEKMKKASDEAIAYLEQFLEKHPERKFHFVLGNHENIRYFTKRLDELQAKHKDKKDNFNWSPEAIRLGDALFTHGDLQMSGQIHSDNELGNLPPRGTFRFRHMDEMKEVVNTARGKLQRETEGWQWTRALASAALSVPGLGDLLVTAGLLVADRLGYRDSVSAGIKKMHDYLHDSEFAGNFHYLDGCGHEPQKFTLEGIKHVFFGHTHLPFDNREHEGITYHNTGSLIKGQGIGRDPLNMQALSFELTPDGKVENVGRAFGKSTQSGAER
jgi:predicted phosphodiesterase